MMMRSCVFLMAAALLAVTAQPFGASSTTTSQEGDSRGMAAMNTGPGEGRHGEEMEEPGSDEESDENEGGLAPEERMRRHRQKIEGMIDANRRKRVLLEERFAPERERFRKGWEEEEEGPGRERGEEGQYVVRVAAGLTRQDADELKSEIESDSEGELDVLVEPARMGADRFDVSVGPFRMREGAGRAYRQLVGWGYRFQTLPGWGSVIQKQSEKEGGEPRRPERAQGPGEPGLPRRPAPMAPPPPPPAEGGRGYLPDFVTSATLTAPGERGSSAQEDELLDRLTSGSVPVSMAFSGVPAERIFDSVFRQTGIQIALRGRASGRPVSVLTRNEPLSLVLRKLVQTNPDLILYASPEGKLELWDQPSFRAEVLPRFTERRVFDVRNIAPADAQHALSTLLTPGVGTIVVLPSNGKVVVCDLPSVLREAAGLLSQIDQKGATPAPPPGPETRY